MINANPPSTMKCFVSINKNKYIKKLNFGFIIPANTCTYLYKIKTAQNGTPIF